MPRRDAAAPASLLTDENLRILRRVGSRALTGLALLLLAFVVGIVGFRVIYGGKVYPAISVADVNLGGMPRADALALLQQRATQLEQGTVTFSFEGQLFTPTLSELGVTIDVERSLDEAYSLGREDDAVDRLIVAHELLQDDRVIPLYAQLDYAALDRWFDSVDAQLGLVPHDAYLVINGASVTIEPEIAGTIVDRVAARKVVYDAVKNLEPVTTPLPVIDWVPNVLASDLEGLKAEVEQALSKPVPVVFGDRTWEIQPADLGRFLIQQNDPSKRGAEAVSITVDQQNLTTWLSQQFAEQVYLAPVDAEVGWNNGPVAITPSVDGHQLKPEAFAKAVAESLLGNHETVQIPVDPIKPTIDSNNLGALGITTQLSTATSNYAGSDWGRATNISVGANLLNGYLVPPGGMFSFHDAIGLISEEAGFVEANVIEAERIGKDVGGGICQVSTTVFRAALLAGMPIYEWWPHDYRLEFYERDGWGPGFDASILQPEEDPFSGGDFKFENPTNGWLLVESWADGTHVRVNIYGPETGWTVEVSEEQIGDTIPPTPDLEVVDEKLQPGCVVHTELPMEGLVVWFTRVVYDAEGNVLREGTFESPFKSRGNVWKVAPDMVGASPAKGGTNWGNCTI